MQALLAVAAGGMIGSVARYLVGIQATRWFGHGFPYGTLAVNILGSFAMGVLVELMALAWNASLPARLFLTVGVLGGFTTFSSFSLDVVVLFERKAWLACALYLAASVTVSILALFAGLALMRRLL